MTLEGLITMIAERAVAEYLDPDLRFRAAVRARAQRRAYWKDEQEDFMLGEGAIKYYD